MVYIIIPAYNEAGRIGTVLDQLMQAGFNNIVVVDDGSKDNTAELAGKKGVVVLQHFINRGQGAALETGNEFARRHGAEAVVHFDADGQFNPADIQPALDFVEKNNVDVVLGSRFLDQRSSIPWLKRALILPLGRVVNYLFTGVVLTDAHNGFRILRGKALEKIRITHDGMAHNTEIVAQLKRHNLLWKEFPVEVRYHEFGQGVKGGFRVLRDLLFAPWIS